MECQECESYCRWSHKLRIDDTKCAIKHTTNKSVTQQPESQYDDDDDDDGENTTIKSDRAMDTVIMYCMKTKTIFQSFG